MKKWPLGNGDEGRKNAITAAIIVFAFAALFLLGQSPQLAVALGFAATGLTAVLALPERKNRNGTTDDDTSTVAPKRRNTDDEVEGHPPGSHSRWAFPRRNYGFHSGVGRANTT